MRPTGAQQEGLAQRIARVIIAVADSDDTSGTVYKEWVVPAEFPEAISPFASNKDEVVKEARQYTAGPEEQSFWKGGSRLDTLRAGASLGWR